MCSAECQFGAIKCTAEALCIHPGMVCDGQEDCSDGEDEQNCDGGIFTTLLCVYLRCGLLFCPPPSEGC